MKAMTRDDMIELARQVGQDEDGEPAMFLFRIADERLSEEEESNNFVPWSERELP